MLFLSWLVGDPQQLAQVRVWGSIGAPGLGIRAGAGEGPGGHRHTGFRASTGEGLGGDRLYIICICAYLQAPSLVPQECASPALIL